MWVMRRVTRARAVCGSGRVMALWRGGVEVRGKMLGSVVGWERRRWAMSRRDWEMAW